MSFSKFSEIFDLSNEEIIETIVKIETNIFKLKFKKATRQIFKIHELKKNKRRLAKLKTLLRMRVETNYKK